MVMIGHPAESYAGAKVAQRIMRFVVFVFLFSLQCVGLVIGFYGLLFVDNGELRLGNRFHNYFLHFWAFLNFDKMLDRRSFY